MFLNLLTEKKPVHVVILALLVFTLIWIPSAIAWGQANEALKKDANNTNLTNARNSAGLTFVISSIIFVYLVLVAVGLWKL